MTYQTKTDYICEVPAVKDLTCYTLYILTSEILLSSLAKGNEAMGTRPPASRDKLECDKESCSVFDKGCKMH